MNYVKQFRGFVKAMVRKNMNTLPNFTQHEIEAECWGAIAIAMGSWDGSKGKLGSWIYTAVVGRMTDLRKRPALKVGLTQDFLDYLMMDNETTIGTPGNN